MKCLLSPGRGGSQGVSEERKNMSHLKVAVFRPVRTMCTCVLHPRVTDARQVLVAMRPDQGQMLGARLLHANPNF